MITQISYKNFRSIQDATIELTPLNVFVGANNSGKSNALLALSLLQQLATKGDFTQACEGTGVKPDTLISRGKSSCTLSISGAFRDATIRYTIEFDKTGRGTDAINASSPPFEIARKTTPGGPDYQLGGLGLHGDLGSLFSYLRRDDLALPAGAREFCDFLSNVAVYDLSVPALKSESPLQVNPKLSRNGDNLASVLDWLRDNQADTYAIILEEVRSAAKDIKTIAARTTRSGVKVLALTHQNGEIFDASVLSDGLVMFVGLAVAAASSRLTPTLIAVEEPERGVHPRRLREVLDAFRRVSTGGTQIVLTTHSPIVLDAFRDEPEGVFLFDRSAEGTTVARLSDSSRLDNVKDLALGEAWFTGLLGGLPQP